jgi:hypothetical protein
MTAVRAVSDLRGKEMAGARSAGWRRLEPLSGVAFIVFFIASVMVSSVPAATEADQTWVAYYTGTSNQIGHLATGICLVLASMSLLTFLSVIWTRIAAARRPEPLHPLPLVAAGAASACIAAGGVLMASVSGSLLVGGGPVPGADVIRLANDVGFGMVALAGMSAVALSLVCLGFQARSVGLFGTKTFAFTLIVALALLGALAFIPIAALFIWVLVMVVTLMRSH